MSYQEIIEKIKPELQKAQEYFREQMLQIKAGKIGISLIEEIKVNCFGQELSLKQIGTISHYSPKEILIQLWDKSYVENVISAIEKKKLGFGVRAEGSSIFLSFPPITEETKRDLVKILNEKKENIFQNMRRIRDKAWGEIQDCCRKGEIREDDKYRGKDKLEDSIKQEQEKIEKAVESKRKEIEG
ncbi:ribosome-recycling factor [Patescibacteria group bacterium]|nr:ribosome-recycling factor [Patescibacteria group bacterium]